MEIKAVLQKPYKEEQRLNFIVLQNHTLGYEIKETETELQAWGKDEAELLEDKKRQVRAVRSRYFSEYVDWYQSKPLLWNEMTDTEKQYIAEYRTYLMDYTEEENWWEKNPMTYEEWLVVHHPVGE